MNLFTQAIISGLMSGAVYALLATGLVLAFNTTRVVNLAHGETYAVSGLTVAVLAGMDVPMALALEHGSEANAPLARWGTSTGKWAQKDMDVVLDLAQEAGLSLPLNGLVDQLIRTIDQGKMKGLLTAQG